jgi:hypothetical protein
MRGRFCCVVVLRRPAGAFGSSQAVNSSLEGTGSCISVVNGDAQTKLLDDLAKALAEHDASLQESSPGSCGLPAALAELTAVTR